MCMDRRRLRLLPLLVLVVLSLPAISAATKPAPASVITYGYGNTHTGYNAGEHVLGPVKARGLHKLWAFDIGGATIGEPVLAAGVRVGTAIRNLVFVGSENGTLFAVDAVSGRLVWKRTLGSQETGCSDMPGGLYGVSSTPAIDRATGALFVAGGDGKLFGLSLSTGKTLAGWPQVVTVHPAQEYVYSAITRGGPTGDRLYVETASYCDATPYHGRVEEFSVAKHRRVATWYVVGDGSVSGGGIWGQAGVSLDAKGNVYTATGNAMTSPETYGYGEAIVRLGPNLGVQSSDQPNLTGGDVDYGASPMLFRPKGCPLLLTVENKSGVLFVFHADSIHAGPIQALQVGNVGDWQFNAIPAWDPVSHMVYVADSSSSTDPNTNVHYSEGLIAFHVANCMLKPRPAWLAPTDPGGWVSMGPPTVADGVVYYGDGFGDTLFAYDAATGAHLWNSGSTIAGGIWSAPLVANGRLYTGSWDGHLYAFGPA